MHSFRALVVIAFSSRNNRKLANALSLGAAALFNCKLNAEIASNSFMRRIIRIYLRLGDDFTPLVKMYHSLWPSSTLRTFQRHVAFLTPAQTREGLKLISIPRTLYILVYDVSNVATLNCILICTVYGSPSSCILNILRKSYYILTSKDNVFF